MKLMVGLYIDEKYACMYNCGLWRIECKGSGVVGSNCSNLPILRKLSDEWRWELGELSVRNIVPPRQSQERQLRQGQVSRATMRQIDTPGTTSSLVGYATWYNGYSLCLIDVSYMKGGSMSLERCPETSSCELFHSSEGEVLKSHFQLLLLSYKGDA